MPKTASRPKDGHRGKKMNTINKQKDTIRNIREGEKKNINAKGRFL